MKSQPSLKISNKKDNPGDLPRMERGFTNSKLVLEKAEEQGIKMPTSAASLKKQESSRKTSISALLTMAKLFIVWITINCGKF